MANISVIKRNNSWQYRFDIAKLDGKRKQVSKSGYRTKKEAESAGIQALSEYHQTNRIVSTPKISFADYLDEWFKAYCVLNTRFNTQLHHSRIILSRIKPSLGKYYLEDISTSLLQDFVNSLLLGGVKLRYTREIFAIISLALKYAVEPLGIIKENPAKGVIFPKMSRHIPNVKRSVISGSIFQKIMKEFPEGSPAHIPLMLGYHAGLRIGEVFALSWDDIDLEKGTISIHATAINKAKTNTITPRFYGWYLGPPKTKSSNRTIYIDQILLQALVKEKARQLKRQELLRDLFKIIYKKTEITKDQERIYRLVEIEKGIPVILPEANMVCVDDYGSYLSYERFKKYIRIIRTKLGIEFNFHSLRHSHATILIQEGANMKDVQERLGHSSIQMTMDTYAHVTDSMKKDSVQLFENHIKGFIESLAEEVKK